MSLYRKYRPQTFEDVIGQDHIAQTLRNALAAQPPRVAHAYLFCGPRGTGKTSSARLLAKCLNCESFASPTATPCNSCDFCVGVTNGHTLMDLVEIDAASNTQVDKVRERIIETVDMAPAQGRYRIYIIDEVHMLSTSSFNALLKTLEEPPAHAIFVLATTDAHKVPTTIASRCQRFDFRRVTPIDIAQRLEMVARNEGFALDADAARLIALQADGALRDGLTLLEQVAAFSAETVTEADVRLVLGTVSHELLVELVDAVVQSDPAAALAAIDRATEQGVSFSQLAGDLTNYCRDLLLLTVGFEANAFLSEADRRHREMQARTMGRSRVLNVVEQLRLAEKEMRFSNDHRLLLELTLVRAAGNEPVQAALAAPPAPALHAQAHAAAGAPAHNSAPPAPRPAPRPVAVPAVPAERVEAVLEAAAPVVAETAGESVEAWKAAGGHHAPEATSLAEPDAAPTIVSKAPPVAGYSPAGTKGRRIGDLAEFIELWPAVLARVRRKIGVTAVAYLHDAMPVALDENEAVLEFKKEFHYEKACEALKRLPFEKVLNECMARPHRLRLQLALPAAKVAAKAVAAPAESGDDDEEDIMQLAQHMFGANIVGRSSEG